MDNSTDYCATETPHVDREVSSPGENEEFEVPSLVLDAPDEPESVYATLHFNLEQSEGERRLRECLDAPNVKAAVSAFVEWLRRRADAGEGRIRINKVWDRLHEEFMARDVTWEE